MERSPSVGLVVAAVLCVAQGCSGWTRHHPSDPDADADDDRDEDEDEDDAIVPRDADAEGDEPDVSVCPEIPPECDLATSRECGEGQLCGLQCYERGPCFQIECLDVTEPPRYGLECSGFPLGSNCPTNSCTTDHNDHQPTFSSDCFDSEFAQRCHGYCWANDPTPCTGMYPQEDGSRRDGICILSLERYLHLSAWAAEIYRDLRACAIPSECDPRCQDCVSLPWPDGELACVAVTDGLHHGRTCISHHDLTAFGITGDPCAGPLECSPGYHCHLGECRPYCDLTGAGACPFSVCGAHEGPVEGTCQVPPDEPPELFGPDTGLGLCLSE